jgi:uncharacterized protein YdaU (DUF1376 family)
MNGLPYYKAYPRDFIEGTVGMSFEMKAAYRLVLDLIYMQGGRLPDDAGYISGLLGCSVRKWNALRSSLIDAGKLYASDGIIGNFRADNQLETSRKLQEKNAENGRQSSKNKDLAKSNDQLTRGIEPDTETVDSSDNSENIINVVPAGAGIMPDDRYAFSGSTIRLTAKDLETWRRSFPHISLEAELWALDPWAADQKASGKNWFHAVSNALAKKERTVMERIHMAAIPQVVNRRLAPDPRI